MKSLLLFFPAGFDLRCGGKRLPVFPRLGMFPKVSASWRRRWRKLKPVLAQLTPQAWVEQGAPAAYVAQWQSAQQELDYLDQTARALEKQPEKLTAALDVYFRLQGVEWRLESLSEGARKYQNPAAGDQLAEAVGVHATKRDQLRQYITDLAAQNEQEFAVVEREAQRCREEQNTPRPAARRRPRETPRRSRRPEP